MQSMYIVTFILQILHFLRPDVPVVGNKSYSNVAIYLQGLNTHIMEIPGDIKESIKQIGGNTRVSLRFNQDESTNNKFKPSESKQRRCVTMLHKSIPQHLLNQMKATGKIYIASYIAIHSMKCGCMLQLIIICILIMLL